jgi:hypothetical protein
MRVTAAAFVAAVLATMGACGEDGGTGPEPATMLVFSTQPSNDTVGSSITTITVTARTAGGAVATGFAGTVVLTLGANPGGAALSGTTSVVAAAGVASFPDVSLNKAEDGYTLTATAGSLSATSAAFDISEVVTRYAPRYYYGLDLETGAIDDCNSACPATHDFNFAYNSVTAVHARVFQRTGRQIAHLTSRTFASVHLADTAGAGLTTSLIDQPFDNTRTVLVRTTSGNVYKLGNPTEFGTNGADSVRLTVARLN